MSPVTTHSSMSPPVAVKPATSGVKQPSVVTVPSAKPSASVNENPPSVIAASVSTSVEVDVSEMPFIDPTARNPRAPAVIVPAPLTPPPSVCNRTVVVPAETFCETARSPVTRQTVTLSSVVVIPLVAPTVPMVRLFKSR